MKKPRQLTRREFIKSAGGVVVIGLPAVYGVNLARLSTGEPLPNMPVFADGDQITCPLRPAQTEQPLLLVTNEGSDNRFGAYLGEILRAEGLNCFEAACLADLDEETLPAFDIVLLAEGPLDARSVELLEAYVAGGGRLVAMRPDRRLAGLLGLEWAGGVIEEGYLQVDESHPIAAGIHPASLQFHGQADQYRPAGAQVVAWMAEGREVPKMLPAVTIHTYGKGMAAMWAFDLARSVAYTRQGNPVMGQKLVERGKNDLRPVDLFWGWVDLDRVYVPQADVQQRLLANLLSAVSQGARPLPRFWYFPRQVEGLLVATGDSHMNPGWAVEKQIQLFNQRNGHISIYYSPHMRSLPRRITRRLALQATDWPLIGPVLQRRANSPTQSEVEAWRAQGHEITFHPWVEEGIQEGWENYWREFTGIGYGVPTPTVRTHRVQWEGWVETARIQAGYGIRLNLDYYHWGKLFRKSNGEWVHGHFTGSGLPMKFVDENGLILNIYQQLTQIADDHLLNMRWSGVENISPEEAAEIYRQMLRRSLDEFPSAITAQFHTDSYYFRDETSEIEQRFVEGILDTAVEHNIPIWTAQDWLYFTEMRHDTVYEAVEWEAAQKHLRLRLTSGAAIDRELELMLPLEHNGGRLAEVKIDGSRQPLTERRVGGVLYGCAPLTAGAHEVTADYA